MRTSLRYPPVTLSGRQALTIANGFATQSIKCGYAIWACAILPEHTHLVVARHRYKVEQVVNLLKGCATSQLLKDGNHPLNKFAGFGQRPPHMWARGLWKVYLDSDDQIENAIAYVMDNPTKEGKPRQNWAWITPYSGIEFAWKTYL